MEPIYTLCLRDRERAMMPSSIGEYVTREGPCHAERSTPHRGSEELPLSAVVLHPEQNVDTQQSGVGLHVEPIVEIQLHDV